MGKKVSRESAVAALVAFPTIKEAAAKCGVSEKTLHKWLKEPEFAKAVQDAQESVTREAIKRVIQSVGQAVNVLEEIMSDAATPPAPRVTAAKALLEQALKVYDLESVQKRLDALERGQYA